MIIDTKLAFLLPDASPASMIDSDGVAVVVGSVIDLSGVGSGTAIPSVIGNAALFGTNPGVGRYRPQILISVGTAFTTGNSATANFALQYAPDNGSDAPGTYETASETGAKAAAYMTAGKQLILDLAPTPPGTPRPRFARLLMQVPASTHFTAGTIDYAIISPVVDQNTVKQAAKNYKAS